jgi:hypothetical protein
MLENDWLDSEIKSINMELKQKKKKKDRGEHAIPHLMIMAAILLFMTFKVCANETPCCPYCNEDITEIVSGYSYGWLFPNTWRCPNLNCGYDNYEGLEYCGRCGTRRG